MYVRKIDRILEEFKTKNKKKPLLLKTLDRLVKQQLP